MHDPVRYPGAAIKMFPRIKTAAILSDEALYIWRKHANFLPDVEFSPLGTTGESIVTLPENDGLNTEPLDREMLFARRRRLVVEALRSMKLEEIHQLVAEIEDQLDGDGADNV